MLRWDWELVGTINQLTGFYMTGILTVSALINNFEQIKTKMMELRLETMSK